VPGAATENEGADTAMAHIEGEVVIKRPVDEVFDFVADERNERDTTHACFARRKFRMARSA
jgi:hypothetical protein